MELQKNDFTNVQTKRVLNPVVNIFLRNLEYKFN